MAPEFKNLEITENIFKSVKFFISGEVHEKVSLITNYMKIYYF